VQVLNRVAIGWLAGHCYLLDSLNVKVLDLSMAVGFTIRQLDTPEELDVYRGKVIAPNVAGLCKGKFSD
jgi:hypothetical protein